MRCDANGYMTVILKTTKRRNPPRPSTSAAVSPWVDQRATMDPARKNLTDTVQSLKRCVTRVGSKHQIPPQQLNDASSNHRSAHVLSYHSSTRESSDPNQAMPNPRALESKA